MPASLDHIHPDTPDGRQPRRRRRDLSRLGAARASRSRARRLQRPPTERREPADARRAGTLARIHSRRARSPPLHVLRRRRRQRGAETRPLRARAADAVSERVHHPVRRTFRGTTAAIVTPAFHDFVIYQLHVGTFFTPNLPAKGGTFLDVARKIPYLAELGVTAIQLLPIQEFQTEFSLGYNGTDYFSPEMDFAVEDAALAPYAERGERGCSTPKGCRAIDVEDLHGEMNQLKALVDLCSPPRPRRHARRRLQPRRRRLRRREPVLLRPPADRRRAPQLAVLHRQGTRRRARVRLRQTGGARLPDPEREVLSRRVPRRRLPLRPGERHRSRRRAARLALLPGPHLDAARPSARLVRQGRVLERQPVRS